MIVTSLNYDFLTHEQIYEKEKKIIVEWTRLDVTMMAFMPTNLCYNNQVEEGENYAFSSFKQTFCNSF